MHGHLGMLVVRGRRKLSVLNVVLVVIVRSRVLYVMLCCPVVNVCNLFVLKFFKCKSAGMT